MFKKKSESKLEYEVQLILTKTSQKLMDAFIDNRDARKGYEAVNEASKKIIKLVRKYDS